MSFSALYEGYIVPATTLIPITAGFVYYKQIGKPLRTLLAYLCIALCINIAGIVMAGYHKNNLPLLHFYTMFELVVVTLYYKHAFNNRRYNKWLNAIIIIYPILCVVNFTFFQSIYTFNTYTRPLEALIIIVLSSMYFAGRDASKGTTAGRWVAGGFLLYFCSSFFQFIFANVVSKHATKAQRHLIWDIHATFVLIMYILFFVAILNGRSKR